MSNLTITTRTIDDVTILDLEGKIRLGEGNKHLHEEVRALVAGGCKKAIVNLEKVSNIDSSGLGELIAGFTTLEKNGGEMKLLNLTKRVEELMMLTKLLTVFDVFENEQDALNSFKKDAADVTAQPTSDVPKAAGASMGLFRRNRSSIL